MQAIARTRTDSWALAAPLACVVHCLAAPLSVAVVPAVWADAATEWVLLGFTVVVGGWVLTQGSRRHGRVVLWVPAMAGVMLWTMSLAGMFEPVPEVVTTVGGSLLVAGALFGNVLWSRRAASAADGRCACGEAHRSSWRDRELGLQRTGRGGARRRAIGQRVATK
jgi:hypothetical protein